MFRRSLFPVLAGLATVPLLARTALAAWPDQQIRMIVPYTPAGGPDMIGRFVGERLAPKLGQPVVVENIPGASGNIGSQVVARAKPDGNTIMSQVNTLVMPPSLYKNVPFDPMRDFAPVTLATRTPMVLAVNPSLPVTSVKELIALAKAKPGALSYGAASIGSTNHLAAELFNSMAQVSIVFVPYKGIALAVNDLISDRLQMMFPAASTGMPHAKSGRLRALAVSTESPSPLAPGLPTVASAGLPGFEAAFLTGMLVRAKTPPPLIQRLSSEIARVITNAEVKNRLFAIGIDAVGNTPDELAQIMKIETAKWSQVIREAGIQPH